ncbi:hypothetical protein [Desulfoplanes sp.]
MTKLAAIKGNGHEVEWKHFLGPDGSGGRAGPIFQEKKTIIAKRQKILGCYLWHGFFKSLPHIVIK